MSYRTEDETKLLFEFLCWLVEQGWTFTSTDAEGKRLVKTFMEKRAIR